MTFQAVLNDLYEPWIVSSLSIDELGARGKKGFSFYNPISLHLQSINPCGFRYALDARVCEQANMYQLVYSPVQM